MFLENIFWGVPAGGGVWRPAAPGARTATGPAPPALPPCPSPPAPAGSGPPPAPPAGNQKQDISKLVMFL